CTHTIYNTKANHQGLDVAGSNVVRHQNATDLPFTSLWYPFQWDSTTEQKGTCGGIEGGCYTQRRPQCKRGHNYR
ncbi:hypothetical protein XELAEV_18037734mg, partial [Xenopus laevis]